jgi:enoyl-CoA hydratase/carnithine racemase
MLVNLLKTQRRFISPLLLRAYSISADAPNPNAVRMIKINNPAKRNALSFSVLQDLVAQLSQIKKETSEIPKVVVIWSEGPVFCSGHDLKELRYEFSFINKHIQSK